jgi:hypothetical protein
MSAVVTVVDLESLTGDARGDVIGEVAEGVGFEPTRSY